MRTACRPHSRPQTPAVSDKLALRCAVRAIFTHFSPVYGFGKVVSFQYVPGFVFLKTALPGLFFKKFPGSLVLLDGGHNVVLALVHFVALLPFCS